MGFSIGPQVFGYGLVIPHYGTIVVGASNKIGNYCVLHTSTCITDNGKHIGNALYLSAGAKITFCTTLGDNVTIAANLLVNKSNFAENVLLAGMPAIVKKTMESWYSNEDSVYGQRHQKVEKLNKKFIFEFCNNKKN